MADIKLYTPAKVGIKSYRYARECISFVHGCSYPTAHFEQAHVESKTGEWQLAVG